MSAISAFKGINNVSDPLRLGLSWLAQADNVDITNTGAIKKRNGRSKTMTMAASPAGAYSTLDFSRLYLVDSGNLKAVIDPGANTSVTLKTGLSATPMHFTEVNGQVFYSNGVDSGIITPDDDVLPWRESALRETPFLDAAGEESPVLLDPLPLGVGEIQHWRARIYAAQHFPEDDQSAVWFSQPLGFHLFNLDTDFILLSGRVTMLAPHSEALIIGTDRAIYAFDGITLTLLAPYGVVPGRHWATDGARVLFWSKRGLCAALPFSNLTDGQISVAPGVHCAGAIVEQGGAKRYIASIQQGGNAFNPL